MELPPRRPGDPHDEPGCFDRVFLQWLKRAWRAERLRSTGLASRTCTWVPGSRTKRRPPSLAFTRDAASGMPYINHLPQRAKVFVVIPVRGWEQPR